MNFRFYKILFLIVSFVFSQFTFAGRFGGGRSYGMQRSYTKSNFNSYRPNNFQQPHSSTPPTHNNVQTNRGGMSSTKAALIGAAAGAAGGYMLAKATSNNQSEQSVDANSNKVEASAVAKPSENVQNASNNFSNQFPWGLIMVLGLLFAFGLFIFRRKVNPSMPNNISNNNHFVKENDYNHNNAQATAAVGNNYGFGNNNTKTNNVPDNIVEKMPDGVETIYFLRQAKGMFLHIQSMNNALNVNEIEKYLTKELYNEIKEKVASNESIADFPSLDCKLINCEEENQQLIASVRFFGMVSEEPNSPPTSFSEVWNFIKSENTNNKWLVAGITPEN